MQAMAAGRAFPVASMTVTPRSRAAFRAWTVDGSTRLLLSSSVPVDHLSHLGDFLSRCARVMGQQRFQPISLCMCAADAVSCLWSQKLLGLICWCQNLHRSHLHDQALHAGVEAASQTRSRLTSGILRTVHVAGQEADARARRRPPPPPPSRCRCAGPSRCGAWAGTAGDEGFQNRVLYS